jgi:hypothetical protein
MLYRTLPVPLCREGTEVETPSLCDEEYPLVNIQKTHGKSSFLMGKSTMSMAIFNSYVTNYQRV